MTDINQCKSFFLQPVCEDEIRNLINNLDTHKATGPDDIPVLVLTLWRSLGFSDFCKKTAVFSCLTNALAPLLIALESCSTAQTDWPV